MRGEYNNCVGQTKRALYKFIFEDFAREKVLCTFCRLYLLKRFLFREQRVSKSQQDKNSSKYMRILSLKTEISEKFILKFSNLCTLFVGSIEFLENI